MSSVLLGLVAALSWGVHDFLARFPSPAPSGRIPTVLAVTFAGLLYSQLPGCLQRRPDPHLLAPALAPGGERHLSRACTLSLYAALALGPLSLVTPIAGSYPALAMIFAVAQGARPSLLQWLAIAAVLAGVMLVSRSGRDLRAIRIHSAGQAQDHRRACLVRQPRLRRAQTSGQAAVPIFGDVAAVWLARIFGLVTIGAIYLMQRPRGELPARWLPLLGLMGGLDVGSICRSPRRRQPARSGFRHGRLFGLQRGHRDPGANHPQGADIADTASRDDPDLWRRCRIGWSLARQCFGNAGLPCKEACEPANRLTRPRGDLRARCSNSRRLAWRG